MDTVLLRGGPRQRGIQQGQLLRHQIHGLWAAYQNRVFAGCSDAEVRPVLANMLRFVEARFPEILEEIAGVAEGAGLAFDDVARLNFGSAIVTTLRNAAPSLVSCSCVAFSNTTDGVIVGKNTDLGDAPESSYALKVVVPDAGLPYVGFGEAGGVWVEAAVNAAGLALGQASAPTQPNQDGFAMPILHSVHLAAQHARSTAEAIDFFGDIVHAGKGLNIMIGDASGNLVAIERGHDRQVVRRAVDDTLYFANHYVTPEMRAAVTSRTDEENSEGRVERYRCLITDLSGERPERSVAGIRRLISDHGGPVSPCQHGHSGMHTRYACVMRPRHHELMLFHGPPCSTEPHSYYV